MQSALNNPERDKHKLTQSEIAQLIHVGYEQRKMRMGQYIWNQLPAELTEGLQRTELDFFYMDHEDKGTITTILFDHFSL